MDGFSVHSVSVVELLDRWEKKGLLFYRLLLLLLLLLLWRSRPTGMIRQTRGKGKTQYFNLSIHPSTISIPSFHAHPHRGRERGRKKRGRVGRSGWYKCRSQRTGRERKGAGREKGHP